MKSDNPYLKELEGMLTFHIHTIAKKIDQVATVTMKERKMPFDMDQLPVLMCVFLGKDLTQQKVATFTSRDKSSVKRTLSVFQKKGLVEILKHPEDGRKTILRTTDTGNFIAEQIRQMVHEAEEEIFHFLSKKTRKELLDALKDISAKISEDQHAE